MPDSHLLGPFVRRFLLQEVVAERTLTIDTQRSYRDSIRLLLRFMADHHATDATRVTVEHITAAIVRTFLAHLEEGGRAGPPSHPEDHASVRLTGLGGSSAGSVCGRLARITRCGYTCSTRVGVRMQRKLTITVDERVYDGLHAVIGRRRISQFIEKLVRPHVERVHLEEAYRQMAADERREAEALEWAEGTVGDVGSETR